jgi:hypothetical protein
MAADLTGFAPDILSHSDMRGSMRAMRLAGFLVLATGCGVTLNSTAINPAPRATTGRDPATVEVYTAGPPPRPRVDVSMTWADLNGPSTDPFGDMLGELRKQAAANGCDALIVQRTSARAMVATCAMYTDGAPNPTAARPPTAPGASPPAPHE